MTDCTVKGCNAPATIEVAKDRKPYCRPHGIAEAERLPKSGWHLLHPSAAAIGACELCGSMGQWVPLDDGERVLLALGKVKEPAADLVAFNPGTGIGHRVTGDEVERVAGWLAKGAELRRPHAVTCMYSGEQGALL